MVEGNTEGILVNESTPVAADSDNNPPLSWWDEFKEYIHTALDVAGAIPVVGALFDGVNGVIYAVEGDVVNSTISFSSAALDFVPGAGTASKAVKFGYKATVKLAEKIGVKAIEKAGVKEIEKTGVKAIEKIGVKEIEKTEAKVAAKEDGIVVKNGKKKSGTNKECPGIGHPVNPVLGIKFLSDDNELDFVLPSLFPIRWQRRYFSDISTSGWLGQGWTLPFSQCLHKRTDGLYFVNEQGTEILLPKLRPGQSKFDGAMGLYFTLESNNRYRITTIDNNINLIFSPLTISSNDPKGDNAHYFPLIAMEDRYGNHIRIIYENIGLPKAIQDVSGQWLTMNFIVIDLPDGTSIQRLKSVTRLHNKNRMKSKSQTDTLVSYCYSSNGDLIRVNDKLKKIRREYSYNNHILIKHSLPGGLIANYKYSEYTPNGKVINLTTNLAQIWSFDYQSNKTKITDPLGRTTYYEYTTDKEWIAFIDAKGQVTRYILDVFGRVVTLITPDDLKTHYSYDINSNITSIKNTAGKIKHIHYNSQNNPISVTDEMGHITRYSYDSFGGMKSITNALGYVTEYSRDKRGGVTGITESDNKTRYIKYNNIGFSVEYIDCSGFTTHFTRDMDGNIECITHPDGTKTNFTYDINHNLIAILFPDGTSEYYTYDILGRKISQRNALGELTCWQLSIDGLPIKRTNPNGDFFCYKYDAARRLIELENENGATYSFTYDENDNLIREQKFDNIVIWYRYNIIGELIGKYEVGTQKDINETFGIRTILIRDKSGNVIEKLIKNEINKEEVKSNYQYNNVGLLTSATNIHSKNEFIYDKLGQCIAEISEVMGQRRELLHTYDNMGNRIKTKLPDSTCLEYLYYGSGHLIQINMNGKVLSEIERDSMNREVNRTQGKLTTHIRYNSVGRILTQKVLKLTEEIDVYASPVISRRYEYDGSGNLKSAIESNGKKILYQYDAIHRLTQAGNENFKFDSANNIIDKDNKVMNNRVEHYENKCYSYDLYGNLIKKVTDKNTSIILHYSPDHQIECIETMYSGKSNKIYYGYDVLGRRIYKKNSDGITLFLWDGDCLLSENNRENSIIYIYNSDRYNPIAQLVKNEQNKEEVYFYHTDQLGTPREMTTLDGEIIWQVSYKAWGNINIPDVLLIKNINRKIYQPIRFQGQYHDQESGLYYNCYRYYDPDIGRFITQDSTILGLNSNAYQYSLNPTNWIDPIGLVGNNITQSTIGIRTLDLV